jgi:uncharacterized membrane protein
MQWVPDRPSLPASARRSHRKVRSLTGRPARLRVKVFFTLAAGVLAAILASGSARAEFTVCNQTLDVVNLAVGQDVDSTFQTDGWWTIGANQCVDVIREELSNRYVYVYATDVFGHAILEGSTGMCVEKRRFTIRGIDDCWQRGHILARFLEVDTLEQIRWTFFLTGHDP